MQEDTVLWGIHAGRTGDADSLFLKKNMIAIGWAEAGDLTGIAANREAFKSIIADTYPDIKPGAIPVYAGLLYRFVHEMKLGDYVAYPSKIDKRVHLGQVTGKYEYAPNRSTAYPNQRAVTWQKSIPRTRFTQGALYEIGSAVSLFLIRNYTEEFLSALSVDPTPPDVEKDETVAIVTADIAQTTRDFILKTLSQELKGRPFEGFVANLLNTMGYRTRIASEGPDGGIDIIAHKDELGFEPPIIKVQVKSTDEKVGLPEVSALYGNVDTQSEFGLIVTLGYFTKQADTFARNKPNLRLIDGESLIDLVLAHYEQFDSRYKGIIPLKHVYIPDPES